MLFSTKMRSCYSKRYKIEYKAIIMVFFPIVLTVHKYEESNVDFNLFLNCCKLGNYGMSLARTFHMCIPLTMHHSLTILYAQILG